MGEEVVRCGARALLLEVGAAVGEAISHASQRRLAS